MVDPSFDDVPAARKLRRSCSASLLTPFIAWQESDASFQEGQELHVHIREAFGSQGNAHL
jgi:hypothetical protein